ncbi:MAG: pyruvate kinase [Campylobacterota bacterium]|nr:pyruvate kinase [Campylobacterota bacterium]
MLNHNLLQETFNEIDTLRKKLLEADIKVEATHPSYQSFLNLQHYLILRQKDHTRLQEKLFLLSLSSLGRSTAHVAASVDTLYDQLACSMGQKQISSKETRASRHVTIDEAITLASHKRGTLFGGRESDKLSKQRTSVMVTLPSYAADNSGDLIHKLADAGVRIFRINTAHDDAERWRAMADVITDINRDRKSDEKMKIFVDLAGPKIRTGRIRKLDLPIVIGSNRALREVSIYPDSGDEITTAPKSTDPLTQMPIPAKITVSKKLFKKIKIGKRVKIIDAHSKKATITITEHTGRSAKGVIDRKVFLDKDSKLIRKNRQSTPLYLESQVEPIRLATGDRLTITEEEILGHTALLDRGGKVIEPALISCSFKGVASFVSVGDKVFIDDGKIGLKVIEKDKQEILCEVTNAKVNGSLLKEEKGINFPDSHINIAALTQNDRHNLLSVIDFADDFSISFCQSADDIREIRNLLIANNRSDAGIIAKIETKRAVRNMPQILEALLECEKSGVMIARGDLAIEVGFTNMAVIQEELLDICNGAHTPVIWATQVLESQMKNNLPSRAEISDAAISGRAECVMLNKGPFAIDTIDILKHILHDMHLLFKKNRKLLGKTKLWQNP